MSSPEDSLLRWVRRERRRRAKLSRIKKFGYFLKNTLSRHLASKITQPKDR